MRLVQSVANGSLRIDDTARPAPGATQVLVRTAASLISSGTERSVRSLASASLLAKARSRPDLVRQVITRARAQGVISTARAVKGRLSEDMPLGYSAAGAVVEVGEAVPGIRPGDRVATAGAPHADFQIVAGNLVVPLPDDVTFEEGAFATVASIALNGLRLGSIEPGSKVLVVGLGLVGQLVGRLACAGGAQVAGIDLIGWKRDTAQESGILTFASDTEGWAEAHDTTNGKGFDAVVIAAATKDRKSVA